MRIISKCSTFFRLGLITQLLFLEAFILLGWARFLKMKRFSDIAPILGEQMSETSYDFIEDEKQMIKNISSAIHIMSKYTFWESQCLVKAIAGMKMLERRDIDSTLYLGTARENDGKLIAHAWLRSGPLYISGVEEMKRFTVVSMFAKRTGSEKGERNEKLKGT
ncbi:lasso peptide biosynthesis B2 protein [Bacillus sp. Y1]|nr:lasso peptide biosynthesis B2 protein [Bacillus sp. Y1]AYA77620.1 lasso peptide biosynthesis B2 protein [Bacillus sp. Y1]